MSQSRIDRVNATFEALFDEVIEVLLKVMSDEDPLYIELPEQDSLSTKSAAEIAQIVARTSNIFSKASRLSGMAKQEVKRAQLAYNYAYKTNKHGKNDDERTANALEASFDEAEQLNLAERMYDVASFAADAARIASESARKLLGEIESIQMADHRENHGQERTTISSQRMDF